MTGQFALGLGAYPEPARAGLSAEQLAELVTRREAYETDPWAVGALARRCELPAVIWDPCAGTGVIGDVLGRVGRSVLSTDIEDWTRLVPHARPLDGIGDFLDDCEPFARSPAAGVVMNPPFSHAVDFVRAALEVCDFVACFQRWAWFESEVRRPFFDGTPPTRLLVCGNRATCWRFDQPADARRGGTSTSHGWFIWDYRRACPPAGFEPPAGRIYRSDAAGLIR